VLAEPGADVGELGVWHAVGRLQPPVDLADGVGVRVAEEARRGRLVVGAAVI
jgi:hypothetical protein